MFCLLICQMQRPSPHKKRKISPLEEIFEEEEREARRESEAMRPLTYEEKAGIEINHYRSLAPLAISTKPVSWWWKSRHSLPMLYNLSTTYLCVQASSTPSERVFSVAGDTISVERSRIRPEVADMVIFLQNNC